MAQRQIFHAAASARREISRTAYILFGAGAGVLACGAVVFAVALARGVTPEPALLMVSGGLSCAGVAGLIAGIITLGRVQQPIEVEVTPYRLIWREGRRIATLEYDEVERVELVRASKQVRGGFTMYYPVVRFIENDGEMMEFEVTFEDRGMIHHSRFDSLAIAQAVLPHLPPHLIVSPALDEFLQTGEVDIDQLPDRS